jgi:hypothetical protein
MTEDNKTRSIDEIPTQVYVRGQEDNPWSGLEKHLDRPIPVPPVPWREIDVGERDERFAYNTEVQDMLLRLITDPRVNVKLRPIEVMYYVASDTLADSYWEDEKQKTLRRLKIR